MQPCCNEPDIRLISDEGYECLACGRVWGHRRLLGALAPTRWLYREQQLGRLGQRRQLYLQDRAMHLPPAGVGVQSVGAAWSQALRGGAELRRNAHNIIRDSREARYGAPCEWKGR